MANIASIVNLLKYAPTVVGAIKQFRGGRDSEEIAEYVKDTRETLMDMKKNLSQRLETLEAENTRLRTRVREMESGLTTLKVLVYTGGGAAVVALILVLILLIKQAL